MISVIVCKMSKSTQEESTLITFWINFAKLFKNSRGVFFSYDSHEDSHCWKIKKITPLLNSTSES